MSMRSFRAALIAFSALSTLSAVSPQTEATTTSASLTMSAIVTITCRLTQDREQPSIVSSLCTRGTDFSSLEQRAYVTTIQRTERAAVAIF